MRLLLDVYQWGAMLRSHLEALYFTSPQRARARLALLTETGYVNRCAYPVAPSIALTQTAEYVYTLGRQGVGVVAAQTGLDAAAIRDQQRHGTPQYLAHALETVSFRLSVLAALKEQESVTVETFFSERQARHAYEARETGGEGAWHKQIYKPDALLILSTPGGRVGYGIEIDLGNTNVEEFKIKMRIHANYQTLGLCRRRYDLPGLTTLTITTSEARLSHLAALVAPEQTGHFLFTTYARLRMGGFLGPVWTLPGQSGTFSLCALGGNGQAAPAPADTLSVTDLQTKEV